MRPYEKKSENRQIVQRIRHKYIGKENQSEPIVDEDRPPIYWPTDDRQRAEQIRQLKRGCTYRFLAGEYYPKDHMLHGNQLAGIALARWACDILFPGEDIWMTYRPEEKYGKTFIEENCWYGYNPDEDDYVPYWW